MENSQMNLIINSLAVTTTPKRDCPLINIASYVHLDTEGIGVAMSKNKCIKQLYDLGNEWFILCDDDMWFIKEGIEEFLIMASQQTGIHHFIYTKEPHNKKSRDFDVNGIELEEYEGSGGVLMFFSREVVDTIGYYSTEYGKYSFEHSNYSNRVFKAGLMPNCKTPYVLPRGLQDYIYANDYDKKLTIPSNFTDEEKAELISKGKEVWIKDNENIKIYYSFDN